MLKRICLNFGNIKSFKIFESMPNVACKYTNILNLKMWKARTQKTLNNSGDYRNYGKLASYFKISKLENLKTK